MGKKRKIGIVIFDEVEVLDFCGPFEVFSVTGGREGLQPFEVFTVAEESRPINARGGLSINPSYSFENCPRPDILLVPGGFGTRREMKNAKMLEWLKKQSSNTELMLSVCSGSLLLGTAGLLHGLTATTHHAALDELRKVSSSISIDSSRRFIDNG